MKPIKALLLRLFRDTELFLHYSLPRAGYLAQQGWFESWRRKRPVDRTGRPLPWITYPCIAFLERRLQREMEVFEYGCGNSTLWWAQRVQKVTSCEHDPAWFEEVRRSIPPNVELHLRELTPATRYSGMIATFRDRFDVVFIDGRDRVNCIKNCLPALRTGGVVILDNSDLTEYADGINFLRQHGYRALEFDGPGPVTSNAWRTTIFYQPGNCLGI